MLISTHPAALTGDYTVGIKSKEGINKRGSTVQMLYDSLQGP